MKRLILMMMLCAATFASRSQTYCTLTTNGGCSGGNTIDNFTFATINNSSNCDETVVGEGYKDFTSVSTIVNQNCTYNYSITKGTITDQVSVFMDFNGDGDFADAGEFVAQHQNPTNPATGSVTIPAGFSGNGRIRISVSTGLNLNSCGTTGTAGEVEDYLMNIQSSYTADAGPDQNIGCNTTTTLAGNDPAPQTGMWTVVSGTGTFADATLYNTTVSNISVGDNVYRWTVTNGSCPIDDDVTINRSSVESDAGTDTVLCVDNLSLNANTPFPGETGTWSRIGQAGGSANINDVNDPNTLVTNLTVGIHLFEWTVTDGTCTKRDTVQVSYASTITWTGAGANDLWDNADNWDFGVPLSCHDVIIPVTGNDPQLTDSAAIQNITIATSATLTIAVGGDLNSLESATVNGTLINNGEWTMAAGKNFSVTASGKYTHNPSVNNTAAASATMFTNANNIFAATSTLEIQSWYDVSIPMMTDIEGNLGHLIISPSQVSPIFDGTEPVQWYQNNTLGNAIQGDLTLFEANLIVASLAGPTTPITTDHTLTVGGTISLRASNSTLVGFYHRPNNPLSASSGNLTIQAGALDLQAGTLYLAENRNNSPGTMTGNFSLIVTGSISVINGQLKGSTSTNGVQSGASITIQSGSTTLGTDAIFYGVENNAANFNYTSGATNLAANAVFRGITRAVPNPGSGDATLNVGNLSISGGTFLGINNGTGDVIMTAGTIALTDPANASTFKGIVGTATSLSAGTFGLNGASISVDGSNSILDFIAEQATGVPTVVLTGNVEVLDGQMTMTKGTANASLTLSGNMTIGNGDFFQFIPGAGGTANTAIIQTTVNGNYVQTNGRFEFDSLTNNAGATRVLNVLGDFTISGGNFRMVQEETSTLSLSGTLGQTISTTPISLWNFVVNDAGHVAMTNTDLTIENNITLNAGRLMLTNSNLILEEDADPIGGTFSANTMITTDGTSLVSRQTSAAETFTFPLGDIAGTAQYSPIDIEFNSATFGASASYGARVIGAKHPNNNSANQYLTRFWHTESSDITAIDANITATYDDADIVGTETNIAHGTWSGSLPWNRGAAVFDADNELRFENVISFDEYTGIRLNSPVIDTILGDTSRCDFGDSVQLQAQVSGDPGFTYSWSPLNGLSNATISNPKAAPNATTTYTLTVTDTNGQVATRDFTLTVFPRPADPTVTTPVEYCQNETATALTAGGTDLLWYNMATGGTGDPSAPTPSTATVGSESFYVTQTVNGCESNRSEIVVNVSPEDDASFDYNGTTTFCNTGVSPAANITGETGGTFSGTPGLAINASTGEINLTNSTTGSHTVTYETTDPCSNTSTLAIDIVAEEDISFTYPTPICESDANPLPTFNNGPHSGTFSNTGGIVFVDASTGEIDLSASTPGTETIVFDVPATAVCPAAQETFDITINPTPANPTFTSPVTYCRDETATQLSATGSNILWYANRTGGTGDANAPTPSTATVGTEYFYLSQTVNGCESERDSIEVNTVELDDASFDYGGTTDFCQGGLGPAATTYGSSSGTFSGSTGLIVDASTGSIDLNNSPTGSHRVYFETSGPCINKDSLDITITAPDDISFSYTTPHCQSDANITPTFTTGSPTGTFSNSSGVVFADANTGEINLSASSAGNHRIFFNSDPGPICPSAQSFFDIVIEATPGSPTFTSPVEYCQNDTPTQLSATGSNVLWYADRTGGTGDPNAPTPSTAVIDTFYFYLSQTVNGCESIRDSIEVIVHPDDDPTFSYPSTTYATNQPDPTPTISGDAGGTFSGNNGLVLNSATGVIDLDANTPGTYQVTYTTNGFCPQSFIFTVTIEQACQASFTYPDPVCLNEGTNPVGTIDAGTGAGTYSSDDVTILDAGTGEIDLASATAGTHRIYYTLSGTCTGAIDSFDITLVASPLPTGASPIEYCQNEGATPIAANGNNLLYYTVPNGGTGNTNAPIPSTASPGTTQYFVSQTINGCESDRLLIEVNVTQTDDASFAYGSPAYCENSPNPTPTITGLAGGTFSGTNGLVINNTTGEIDMSANGPGTYTVSYMTNGPCPASSSTTIDIVSNFSASFTYPSPICKNDDNPVATVDAGSASGQFGSMTLNIINSTTGEIDMATASAGTHRIYNAVQASGTCSFAIDSFDIVINNNPGMPLGQTGYGYCQDATATQLSATGMNLQWYTGSTSNTPTAAAPTPATDVAGNFNYFVTQTVNGCESNPLAISVLVNPKDDPSFQYPTNVFCETGANPVPTITGNTGGTFSGSTGLIIDANTGEINVLLSPAGSHSVQYLTNDNCPDSLTVNIAIVQSFDPDFTYNTPVCLNDTNPIAIVPQGNIVGVFSSNTVTILNTSDGEIDLSTATPGIHRVYNSVQSSGACPAAVDSFDIELLAAPNAPIGNNPPIYCEGVTASPLTANGNNLLWYTTPTGGTGDPNAPTPSTATPGTEFFYVSQSNAGCESFRDTIEVTVVGQDNPDFDYATQDFCISDGNPFPSYIITPGGTFSATNNLVINPNNGTIDLSASGFGTYDVTYTTSGTCPNSITRPVAIDTFIDGSFFYSGNFCKGPNGENPVPTFVGNSIGGTFSSNPVGVFFVDPSTGEIDLNGSLAGSFTITNTTQSAGGCPSANHTSNITIYPMITVNVDDKTIECGGSTQLTAQVNILGGTYLWTPGNQVTQAISVSPAVTSDYIVEYDAGNGCIAKDTATVTVEGVEVTLEPFDESCAGHPAFGLTGGAPQGGNYSGPGVSNSIFYPSEANLGNNTITYSYTSASGCSGSATATIFVDECLGIEETEIGFRYAVVPNPSRGTFNIQLDQPQTGLIELRDLNGKLISTRTIEQDNQVYFNQDQLPNGVYLLYFQFQNGQAMERIVIQK